MAGDIKRRTCGTMQAYHRMIEEVPSFQKNLMQIEHHVMEFSLSGATARRGVTKVPVVVHVVYNDAGQNVSDAQIKSQLVVLNEDYRATNKNKSKVPSCWKTLIADAQIEFALATKDPDGKKTNGIVRVKTNQASFAQDDTMKRTKKGGSDAWPSDRYLNIWLCNLTGVMGYTHFPGGPADTDGVVILYSCFGKGGSAKAPFNLGRTATHEIGHWLNLHHVWGDKIGCTGTDMVSDTPTAQAPNYGKPSFPHVTCNNAPNGDMFMNFLDYVDDDSMALFTPGQVVRMGATLDGPRKKIGT